jgi:hypothetical protein
MKYAAGIITSLVLLQSCASKILVYDYRLAYPVESKRLYVENDRFSIAFDVTNKEIGFTIFNKMNEGIRINWDEVSFSINGKATRAVHKATGVLNINQVQPPTTIPPKSTLEDFIMPAENVAIGTAGMYTRYNILPTDATGKKKVDAAISKYKGTKITVYLPFYIAGKYESYYYDIMIDDVRAYKDLPKEEPVKTEKKKKKKK